MPNLFSITSGLGRYWPAGANLLLEKLVPLLIPLTSGLGLRVEHNGPDRTVLRLPLKRRTRNHVGSMYFGAQVTLAEITMGLHVFNRYPPGPYGLLVKRVEVDFAAKAKSGLRAVCEPDAALLEDLARQLEQDGKADVWFEVSLLDDAQKEVTRARFLAAVKDFAHR